MRKHKWQGRSIAFAILISIVPEVSAGFRVDFAMVSTGDPLNPLRNGTIYVDGPSYRVDFLEGAFGFSSVISTDGGKTETALNEELSTYFRRKFPLSKIPPSRLLVPPIAMPATVKRISVKRLSLRETGPTEIINGYSARKYVLTLGYEVDFSLETEKIRARFDAVGEFWTADKLPIGALPFDGREFHTGFTEVDTAVRRELSTIGLPLRRRLVITRRIGVGEPQTDTITAAFTAIEPVSSSPGLFDIPPTFRYQEPILGAPGN